MLNSAMSMGFLQGRKHRVSENRHALESKLEAHLFQFLSGAVYCLLMLKVKPVGADLGNCFGVLLKVKRQLLKYRESDLMELGSII